MAIDPRPKFDFNHLFTFEMANNHQGKVDHGQRIIKEVAKVAKEFGVRAAVKLQFRDLDSFIHPEHKESTTNKHISRFLSTKLSEQDFAILVAEVKQHGLVTMATPFDEASVDLLERLGIEVAKVASCSAHDWPLLERIATTGKPIIISVGGLTLPDIDRVVSFFEHRGSHFALMHCVAIYPTPNSELALGHIETLRRRYPQVTIGFSTHEEPKNVLAIALAYARGARIFEKHVGVPTDEIKLNAYSATPDQLRSWLRVYQLAVEASGLGKERVIPEAEERDLRSLMRGVYLKKPVKAGQPLTREEVFFAMPLVGDEQLTSGQFKPGVVADRDYAASEPLSAAVRSTKLSRRDLIYGIVREAKAMLNYAQIALSHDFQVEISHHLGLERFKEAGCLIIDCFNREYAKKLIIQFPGQFHPAHYHKNKDETFYVLYGSMEAEVEGRHKVLYPGDVLWLPRGVWHNFRTDEGVIFEEVSTTSQETAGDSYYIDKDIAKLPREARKTKLLNWGRHQFDNLTD